MIGLSMPMVIALVVGSLTTYTSGSSLDVEHAADLGQHPVDPGELPVVDADPAAEVVEPNLAAR